MNDQLRIIGIDPADTRLDALAAEARAEGYGFVDRLLSEARAGVNSFDRRGETFCAAFLADALVGCGGVNLDPYLDQGVGRLRHVYVSRHVRRRGVAAALVHDLVERSRPSFSIIRLRISDERAARVYEALGFSRTAEHAATHVLRLHAFE